MCAHVDTPAHTVALNKGREGLLQHRLQEDSSLSTPFFPPQHKLNTDKRQVLCQALDTKQTRSLLLELTF